MARATVLTLEDMILPMAEIPRVKIAVLGGSTTIGSGFPRGYEGVKVIADDLVFETPFGPTAPFIHGEVDGKPLLWETLAEMPGDMAELGQRYVSEAEARVGHEKIVLEVQARLNVTEAEVDELVAGIMGTPVPRPRKLKDPRRKLPDPNCTKCHGSGEDMRALIPDTACDCTIVLRKKNADW